MTRRRTQDSSYSTVCVSDKILTVAYPWSTIDTVLLQNILENEVDESFFYKINSLIFLTFCFSTTDIKQCGEIELIRKKVFRVRSLRFSICPDFFLSYFGSNQVVILQDGNTKE